MRELESSLQRFAEFLLKGQLIGPKAAPFAVRWVRSFLQRPAQDLPLGDQVRQFYDALEREGRWQDWQVRQAEQALRIYFVNFLQRTDWRRAPSTGAVDAEGRTTPLEALHLLRQRGARSSDPITHLIVLLGGDTGLRCGEVMALEWGDVDLEKRQLCVQRFDWKGHVTTTKGGRLRYVPPRGG